MTQKYIYCEININDIDGNGRYDVNDFLKMNNEEILKENNGKKFDICLMNPPYQGNRYGDGLFLDFINKCVKISKKTISINPLNMIIAKTIGGALKNKMNEMKDNINKLKPEIDILNRDEISKFDAGFRDDMCIISFLNNNDKIIINKDNKIYKFDNHSDIMFSSNYIKEFKTNLYKFMIGEDINEYIHLKYPKLYTTTKNDIKIKHDNVYNHLNFNGGEPYAKMNAILDKNPNKDSLFIFLYQINGAFKGILRKSWTYDKAIPYDENIFKHTSLLYITLNKNDLQISKNICSYLNSNFCKLILSLGGLYFHKYLKYDFMPWLDFSKEWTDEELFEMIGMKYDKEEIDKIIKK